jgi:hypothetical protein
MSEKRAGIDFPLENDQRVLNINSPQDSVSGPYEVIYRDIDDRWAVVTLRWDKKPCLGIRWFWGNSGNPSSRSYATWLVIPDALADGVLSGLNIDESKRANVKEFLLKR